MPELSVLLCAKNAASTISAAVRSTLRALPGDGELVVLDDGSTDDTLERLSAITDRRLRFMRSPENLGCARARAHLLAETDSKYIGIMDADDICAPWRFSVQLRQLAHGADLVVAPVVNFGPTRGRVRPGLPLSIGDAAMPLILLLGCPLSYPTLTVRRDAVVEAGEYSKAVAEDYVLYLRAVANGRRLRRGPVPVLAYRNHAGQASRDATFRERAIAEGTVGQAYRDFVDAVFGLGRRSSVIVEGDIDGALSKEELGAVLTSEVSARGIGDVQRRIVERYAKLVLGPS